MKIGSIYVHIFRQRVSGRVGRERLALSIGRRLYYGMIVPLSRFKEVPAWW